MLTTKAASYYGVPQLILEASDREGVRSACREIERQVKPKANERYVVAVFKREDAK